MEDGKRLTDLYACRAVDRARGWWFKRLMVLGFGSFEQNRGDSQCRGAHMLCGCCRAEWGGEVGYQVRSPEWITEAGVGGHRLLTHS